MSDHASMFMNVFDYFSIAYEEASDEKEKGLIQLFGRGLYDAMQTSAIYSINRDLYELADYRTPKKWADFRTNLKANTQAIFNHGDPGPENAIVAITTSVQPKSDVDPEIVIDTLMLWQRYETSIYGISATIPHGSDRIHFGPLITVGIQEPKTHVSQWFLTGAAVTEDSVSSFTGVYLSVLAYLDDQIAAGVSGGGYGDGMTSISLLVPDFLTGPPSWLLAS